MSFQNIATAYDLLSSPARLEKELPVLLNWLGSAKKILDLGCGLGDHISKLKEDAGLKVTGMDMDPGMVSEGRRRHPGLDLILGDLRRPPLGEWDALLCLGNSISCLDNETNWIDVFERWKGSTRKGGKCRIQWMLPPESSEENRVVRTDGTRKVIKTLRREGNLCYLNIEVVVDESKGQTREYQHRQTLQCLDPSELIDALYESGWSNIQKLPIGVDANSNTHLLEATHV